MEQNAAGDAASIRFRVTLEGALALASLDALANPHIYMKVANYFHALEYRLRQLNLPNEIP